MAELILGDGMFKYNGESSIRFTSASINTTYTPHGDGLYISQGDAPYIKDLKMRRLYQVFIIDLRTDDVDEWQGIATSDRNAEFKAFAACGFDSGEIDNYQFVTKVLANVAERIETDNG